MRSESNKHVIWILIIFVEMCELWIIPLFNTSIMCNAFMPYKFNWSLLFLHGRGILPLYTSNQSKFLHLPQFHFGHFWLPPLSITESGSGQLVNLGKVQSSRHFLSLPTLCTPHFYSTPAYYTRNANYELQFRILK